MQIKTLVTGYRGFIGNKVFNKLIEMNCDVIGIDLKDGENIANCLPDEDFDYVFHLATLPSVAYSIQHPSYTMRQNTYATSVLLEWSKKHNVKRVVFSSSAAVLGNHKGTPQSPYGLHKLMSEMECRLYSELYGLDTVSLRYFNVYSEDQKYGGAYSTAISAWMEMIKQNKPLRIDGDGSQTRDFIHVDDIISANIFCMLEKQNFKGKTLNVGTGISVSLNYIKKHIDSKYQVSWNRASERIGDIKFSKADISELKKLGWKPKITIDEGLNRCFNRSNK